MITSLQEAEAKSIKVKMVETNSIGQSEGKPTHLKNKVLEEKLSERLHYTTQLTRLEQSLRW